MTGKSFKPAWWLPSPHLQTLWPTLCRRPEKKVPIKRERIDLPDGDFIDLDWLDVTSDGPIVILLHGLEGSIESPYAKGMLRALHAQGLRGVLMHFRGCSGELNRHPRSYHSGETDDINFIIEQLRAREPQALLAAVGFSLGGNVLLKWLGETGKQNPLTAAVAISVPFELQKATLRIQSGFSRIYQWHFLMSLRKKTHQKLQKNTDLIELKKLTALKTLRDFDDLVTAPLHGFASAEDYYLKSSSRQFLKTIQVPTLLLQAKDDPIMTPDVVPQKNELAPSVTLELTEKGGHVGFVTGPVPWRAQYWLEERVPEFLGQHLKK